MLQFHCHLTWSKFTCNSFSFSFKSLTSNSRSPLIFSHSFWFFRRFSNFVWVFSFSTVSRSKEMGKHLTHNYITTYVWCLWFAVSDPFVASPGHFFVVWVDGSGPRGRIEQDLPLRARFVTSECGRSPAPTVPCSRINSPAYFRIAPRAESHPINLQ